MELQQLPDRLHDMISGGLDTSFGAMAQPDAVQASLAAEARGAAHLMQSKGALSDAQRLSATLKPQFSSEVMAAASAPGMATSSFSMPTVAAASTFEPLHPQPVSGWIGGGGAGGEEENPPPSPIMGAGEHEAAPAAPTPAPTPAASASSHVLATEPQQLSAAGFAAHMMAKRSADSALPGSVAGSETDWLKAARKDLKVLDKELESRPAPTAAVLAVKETRIESSDAELSPLDVSEYSFEDTMPSFSTSLAQSAKGSMEPLTGSKAAVSAPLLTAAAPSNKAKPGAAASKKKKKSHSMLPQGTTARGEEAAPSAASKSVQRPDREAALQALRKRKSVVSTVPPNSQAAPSRSAQSHWSTATQSIRGKGSAPKASSRAPLAENTSAGLHYR
jgi:hypothetical protein